MEQRYRIAMGLLKIISLNQTGVEALYIIVRV